MHVSISKKFAFYLSASVCATIIGGPAWANHVDVKDLQANYNTSGNYGGAAPMGSSTSSKSFIVIHNMPYCYTGTLGGELSDPDYKTNRWVLSNNHVLAKENENLDYPESENRTIIQAGLADAGNCTAAVNGQSPGTDIATLARFVKVVFSKGKTVNTNLVDAAIAYEGSGSGKTSSAILGLGDVSGTEVYGLGQIVQKVGRTTAHTVGEITSIGNSLKVSYESGTAYFDNQLGIEEPCGDKFSDSGDSGSLITGVPDFSSAPPAVGLLFAGGGSVTFANQIDEVLSELNGHGNTVGTGEMINIDGSTAELQFVTASDTGSSYKGPTMTDYENHVASCQTGGGGGRPQGVGKKNIVENPAGLAEAIRVKNNHSREIFSMSNVVGHGIGEDDDGNAVINIYISQDRAGRYYPPRIEGIKVRVIRTGPIKAY